jgi:uncharacterized protein with PQ loop repeat
MKSISGVCDIYRNPDTANFVASLIIAFGIVLSYLPQYYDIVHTRTSIGLSPTFLVLISIAGISACSNLILLSVISLPCCSELSRFECVNSQVSLIQVGLQASSTLAMPLLCVIYTNTPENHEYQDVVVAWKRILYYISGLTVLLILAFFTFTLSQILIFAQALGILSTIITFVQYIPQLVETYTLKSAGVLSIAMMCIQTPGGFIWTTTLILKPGSHWSSWMPYLTAASLQGVLLIMSVYYDYCEPKNESLLQGDEPSYA